MLNSGDPREIMWGYRACEIRFSRLRQAMQIFEFRSDLGGCGFQPRAEISLSDRKGANEGERLLSHQNKAATSALLTGRKS